MVRFLLIITLTGLTTFGLLSYDTYSRMLDELTKRNVTEEMFDQMR
jgi:hypothetical protein